MAVWTKYEVKVALHHARNIVKHAEKISCRVEEKQLEEKKEWVHEDYVGEGNEVPPGACRASDGAGLLQEDNTDGSRNFKAAGGRGESSGFLVDGKDMQVSTGLVGGNDPLAGGVQIEVAGGLPPGFLDLDQTQLSRALVDVEAGDAVMATIGGVEEPATGVNEDFRGGPPGPSVRDG